MPSGRVRRPAAVTLAGGRAGRGGGGARRVRVGGDPAGHDEPVGVGDECVAEPERVVAVALGESVGRHPGGRPGEVGQGSRSLRPLLLRPGQPGLDRAADPGSIDGATATRAASSVQRRRRTQRICSTRSATSTADALTVSDVLIGASALRAIDLCEPTRPRTGLTSSTPATPSFELTAEKELQLMTGRDLEGRTVVRLRGGGALSSSSLAAPWSCRDGSAWLPPT